MIQYRAVDCVCNICVGRCTPSPFALSIGSTSTCSSASAASLSAVLAAASDRVPIWSCNADEMMTRPHHSSQRHHNSQQ